MDGGMPREVGLEACRWRRVAARAITVRRVMRQAEGQSAGSAFPSRSWLEPRELPIQISNREISNHHSASVPPTAPLDHAQRP